MFSKAQGCPNIFLRYIVFMKIVYSDSAELISFALASFSENYSKTSKLHYFVKKGYFMKKFLSFPN